MKAISIKQPFAYLIANGYKSIETRKASSPVAKTKHRGKVLICASGTEHEYWSNYFDSYAMNKAYWIDSYFRRCMDNLKSEEGHDIYKLDNRVAGNKGCIIGVGDLVDIRKMTMLDQEAACCAKYPDAMAIEIQNAYPVIPISIKGMGMFQLGVFEVNIKENILIKL
jgi:hypothetical protein